MTALLCFTIKKLKLSKKKPKPVIHVLYVNFRKTQFSICAMKIEGFHSHYVHIIEVACVNIIIKYANRFNKHGVHYDSLHKAYYLLPTSVIMNGID